MLLVASVLASLAVAHEDSRCGTRTPSPGEIAHSNAIVRRFADRVCAADPSVYFCRTEESRRKYKDNAVTIPLAFHVISDGRTGNLTEAEVSAQMNQLNADYEGRGIPSQGSNFRFNRIVTTYTDNAAWHNNPTVNERAFKAALAVDPATTMNQYYTDMPAGLLGWCYFPSDFEEDSTMHGCVNLYSSIPGGDSNNYNGGQTTTHEIGHGLGLYHTFQGGCVPPGDRVADTPLQRSSTSGCPARATDSCGDGPDNIHNYMDYSYDSCMYLFTPGQAVRMDEQVAAFKPGYLGEDIVNQIRAAVPDAWDEARLFQTKMSAWNLSKK
eukprot:TRINITY_DN292_c0_g1_i1.p1 TRINITY_DN292_c0_g1~~TRINITY_DN292_c0_g1_i1.p1  ORF type:complete len:344 (+),score=69.65 TRINITY_DN292_c0_g1_i1:58-1032(+)